MVARQIRNIASNAPETVLNPNLLDVNGNRIALSSLRGKLFC